MARTVTKETTFVKAPGIEKEIALLFNTSEQEHNMLFHTMPDGRIMIGYLIHDEDASDPMKDQDGNGRVYTARYSDSISTKRGFQEALGLDESFEPDLSLLNEEDVVKAAHAKLASDPKLLEAVFQWCRQYYDDEGGDELEYVCKNLKTINDLTPTPLDIYSLEMELWREGRKNGTIGHKYVVPLDVFEHGQVAYSVSGTGPQCQFDTAKGGAVWVPDDCAVDNFEDKNADLETNRAKAREYAKSCVEEYTSYVNGDCWGAVVQYSDGEQIGETMWGLLGHEYALKELGEEFKAALEEATAKTAAPVSVDVPDLDVDKILYRETNGKPHPRGIRERRVVANLIAHLERAGFKLTELDDTELVTKVTDMKSAMELIFNLDECRLYVQKEGFEEQYVWIILGNDLDCICDHSYTEGDPDGFYAVMDAFDAEAYA